MNKIEERHKKLIVGIVIGFLGALLVVTSLGIIRARPNVPPPLVASPCSLVLAAVNGESNPQSEMGKLREAMKKSGDPLPFLEQIGWLYVSKARLNFDPGYYNLAEQCARCMESKQPDAPQALLLRGHVLHNLHRFKEAETLARKLVASRGFWFDYALLGDALMEQGHLDEASDAYQTMVDLKPNLQSYSRAAHVRWLRGDVEGAIEVMQMAARAGNPRAAEPTAWAYTRLATYQWQAGETEQALQSCAAGLEMAPEYAPALLLRGRIFLAARRFSESIDSLRRAAALTSLPEYQWALAEALRDSGNEPEARACETLIQQRGATEDPRTLALFLATRGLEVQKAVRLAEAELKNRADVFTHDALAWSLAAAGQFSLAHDQMKLALAEGTQDARLFYHAAVIAAALDQKEEATRWWTKAAPLQHTLLPSEREELSRKFKNFAVARTGNPVSPPL